MRLILFFDLPVQTNNQLKTYNKFRKLLISKGYLMLQYSVYSKILNNRDAATQHMAYIKKHCPNEGQIRIMLLTEKQYARMEIIVGGKSRTEQIITIEPFLKI